MGPILNLKPGPTKITRSGPATLPAGKNRVHGPDQAPGGPTDRGLLQRHGYSAGQSGSGSGLIYIY